MKVIATIEADAEKVKAFLEHLFQHHPDATIHVNPPVPPITVRPGQPHPDTAGSPPGGPK